MPISSSTVSEEDDIILSELDDDDLVAQMFDDLYDGLKEEIEEGVNILLDAAGRPTTSSPRRWSAA
jgi:methanogenic corrinoid protein MtbC1